MRLMLLVMHKEGNTYLNVKAVKHAHFTGVKSFPNFHGTINEQIGGPLSYIGLTAIHLGITSKSSVNGVIIILHNCPLFINNSIEELKIFHSYVLSKLKELASLIVPMNNKRKNVLLKIDWMLLAFMNKALHAVLTIDRILKTDVLMLVFFEKFLYNIIF